MDRKIVDLNGLNFSFEYCFIYSLNIIAFVKLELISGSKQIQLRKHERAFSLTFVYSSEMENLLQYQHEHLVCGKLRHIEQI